MNLCRSLICLGLVVGLWTSTSCATAVEERPNAINAFAQNSDAASANIDSDGLDLETPTADPLVAGDELSMAPDAPSGTVTPEQMNTEQPASELALAVFDQLREIRMPSMQSSDGSSIFVPAPAIDTSGCGCDTTEWFVSTRHARQDWCEAGAQTYSVYRRDNGGCLVGSSLAELQESIDPCVPTAVFVHGSFVDFCWLQQEASATTKWLRSCRCGAKLQTIYFTWPSDRDARYLPGSVRELTRRAEFNSFYLADLLSRIPTDCRCGGRLTVIGHSHGALMTTAAMHLMGGGTVQGRGSRARLKWKPSIVLAAAAMDRDWLTPRRNDRMFQSLSQVFDRGRYDRAVRVSSSILILRNKHDLALKLYPARRLLAKQSLGKTGLFRRDQDRLGPYACRIHEYDVSRLLGCKHVWPHYLMHRQIACVVAPYLYGR